MYHLVMISEFSEWKLFIIASMKTSADGFQYNNQNKVCKDVWTQSIFL